MTTEDTVVPVAQEVADMSDADLDAAFEQMANEPETTEEPEPSGEPGPSGEPEPAPAALEAEVAAELGAGSEAPPGAQTPETSAAQEQKTVPLAALHEERAKRKELKAQMDRMEGRFQQMVESLRSPEPAPPEPDPIPTLDENPVGHFDQRMAALEAAQQQINGKVEQTTALTQQQEEWNKVMTTYHNDAARVQQANPEWNNAYQFWCQSRATELQAGGASPEQAQHILQQEEAAAVYRALQEGESPAERVYAIAQARGYAPKPAPAAVPAAPAGGPDPAVIAQGQSRGGGMPAGGSPPAADTLEALAAMDDADFEANWDRIVSR